MGRKPKVVAPEPPEIKNDIKLYKCVCCGKETDTPKGTFYKSQSSMFEANDGYAPLCQKCAQAKFEEFSNRFDERTAMVILCHYLDVPFFYALYDSVRVNNDTFTVGTYLRQLNQKQYTRKSFVNTLLDKKELMVDAQKFEDIKENTRWKISEQRNKNNAIDIIGYDPFEGYSEDQRRFLFNNIINYLEEDGIEDDNFKMSQIIQLVNNNYQISQVDMAIARLDAITQITDIRILQAAKKSLVDANDKIAKENGISVRNRQNQRAGQGTLTGLMKYLRELDIEEAEANYYNQLKGPGSQWAANMSFKAIRENGFFDENDFKDIVEKQYLMIQDLQNKLDDIEEANRLLLIENDELKEGGKRGK